MTPRIVRSSNPAGGTAGSAWSLRTCWSGSATAGGNVSTTAIMRTRTRLGADPDVALAAIAMTPERAMRFRGRLMSCWYFFPILLLLGVSLHTDGIRRVTSRDKIQRRWVELSLLALRLGGLVAWCPSCSPRGRRSRSSRCSLLCSVCTWAHRSGPTTSACRSCRPS